MNNYRHQEKVCNSWNTYNMFVVGWGYNIFLPFKLISFKGDGILQLRKLKNLFPFRYEVEKQNSLLYL